MSLQLTVISLDFESDATPVTRLYEQEEVTLGRSSLNDVVLDRPEISSKHLRLRIDRDEDGQPHLFITDLGSLNGTMVENELLEPQIEREIRSNQRIIIGTYLIQPMLLNENSTLQGGSDVASTRSNGAHYRTAARGGRKESANNATLIDAEECDVDPNVQEDSDDDGADDERVVLRRHQDVAPIVRQDYRRMPEPTLINGDEDEQPMSTGPEYRIAPQAPRPISGEATIMDSEDVEEEEEIEVRRPLIYDVHGDVEEDEQSSEPEMESEEEPAEAALQDQEDEVAVEEEEEAADESDEEALPPEEALEDEALEDDEEPEADAEPAVVAVAVTASTSSAAPVRIAGATVSGQLDLQDVRADFEGVRVFDLYGRVVHHGAPLAGVRIDAGPLGSRTTGADGSFRFPDVEEQASYTLRAEKQKFVFEAAAATGKVVSNTDVEFVAKEVFSLTGTVHMRGEPLPDVEVSAGPAGSAKTDAQGRFTFAGMVEGYCFQLSFKKDRFCFECAHGAGTIEKDLRVEAVATKLLTIEGVVRYRGAPLEGVLVDAGPLGKTTTSKDGRYRFENVKDGTEYKIALSKAGYKFEPSKGA